jgi:uncharacterized protein YggT (Ycf19 family)
LEYLAPVFALLLVLRAARVLVIADAIFSWVMRPDQFPRSLTKPLLDPIYAPMRRVLTPFTGSFDLSPLILLILLFALERALAGKRDAGEA